MRFTILSSILLTILAGCQNQEKNYDKIAETWQEKATRLRATPTEKKEKKLVRETIPVSSSTAMDDNTKASLPQEIISVRYYKQDLSTVLRSLGKVGGLNLIVDDSLKQIVTLELNNVTWAEVFYGLLDTYSLEFIKEHNIIRIITPHSIAKKLESETIKEQLNQARQKVHKSSPLKIRTVKIDHLDVEKTAELMKRILSEGGDNSRQQVRGSVEVDKATNTIVINAVAEDINKMLELVEKLDRPAVQVLIEAQIVVTDQRTARELGMLWSGGFKINDRTSADALSSFPVYFQDPNSDSGSGSTTTSSLDPRSFVLGALYEDSNMLLQAQLTALEEDGDAHIVSSPTITTLNNIQAFIESGSEIPYQSSSQNQGTTTEFKKAVLRLEVTPHVIDNNLIQLDVETSNDEPDKTITNADQEPAITTRKAKTTVLLQNGQTTVIAGLTKEYSSEAETGVPILKDIPYLGQLFQYSIDENQMSDLLIFITPYIIDSNSAKLMKKEEPEIQVIGEDK